MSFSIQSIEIIKYQFKRQLGGCEDNPNKYRNFKSTFSFTF